MASTTLFDSAGIPGTASSGGVSNDGMLDQATDFLSAASTIADQAKVARESNNSVWLSRIQSLGETLAEHLIEFTKKAITLAAVKLVLELCAMAIKKLMEVISSRFGYQMEITTPGVVYTGDKKVVMGTTTSQSSGLSNPFDISSFSGARSGMSYM